MKAFGCILISALAIHILVPTSGYEVQPLYGRTFNLFNLLTSPQALLSRLTSLTSRFAILQSTVDILSSQFAALKILVTSLQAQITALQNATPKCPTTVSGGTIIAGKCYTVNVDAAGIAFAAAQSKCEVGLGTLAEPAPSTAATEALYKALQQKFSAKFSTIETTAPRLIWIGYKNADAAAATVIARLSGASVDYVVPVTPFTAAHPTKELLSAAINAVSKTTWTAVNLADPKPQAYICQYDLV